MKLRKKILAGLLALTTMFTMSATAFAEGQEHTDQTTVTVKKSYVAANDGTASPAETFTLEQVSDGVVVDGDAVTAPDLGTITGASFAKGEAGTASAVKDITIALPDYERVGVYEYTLREVAGNTAGVAYHDDDIKLVVTVMQGTDGKIRVAGVHTETGDGEKSDTFTNTYSAGTLSVSKTVAGNMGDHDKYFEFQVTLTGEDGKKYEDSYAVSGGSYETNPDSIAVGATETFYLKDGETISIANLPYGVEYTVTETDYTDEDYETTKTGDTGTIGAASQTASFTNTKTGEVDTGINLDSLPYFIGLACLILAAAVVVIRRLRVSR